MPTSFVNEVNSQFQKRNMPRPPADLNKMAEEIFAHAKKELLDHPKEVTVGSIFKRKELQTIISVLLVGWNWSPKTGEDYTHITYDRFGTSIFIRDVFFASKKDYEQVFSKLKIMCSNEGIKLSTYAGGHSFLFSVPKM